MLSVLTAIVLVVVLLFLSSRTSSDSCAVVGKTYQIIIRNDQASNTDLQARICDQLAFKNDDHTTREIAFGSHEHHVPYDGVTDRILNQGESFTITLNAAGTYHWHDHLHDEITGTFTVDK